MSNGCGDDEDTLIVALVVEREDEKSWTLRGVIQRRADEDLPIEKGNGDSSAGSGAALNRLDIGHLAALEIVDEEHGLEVPQRNRDARCRRTVWRRAQMDLPVGWVKRASKASQ